MVGWLAGWLALCAAAERVWKVEAAKLRKEGAEGEPGVDSGGQKKAARWKGQSRRGGG